ncbi:MAG: hypothetical protein A2Y92_03025 [Chloroflexi bacterium RBG_13_57_8]|nr:MAG: hypothetical protein A2Y92_03025 [Chloroflexi bacterium RBG_13_57_8]
MSTGQETWQRATPEMTLQPGDTIKAGVSSKAQITFFEGSTIELQANAQVKVAEIGISSTGSTTIRLSQQLGKTVSRVKKLVDADSRYEVETPAAIAAVRGSTMAVTVNSYGKTIVANEGGDIRVIVDGIEYIIHEGMQRTIEPGQPPGPEVIISTADQNWGGGGGAPAYQSKLDVTMTAEPAQVRVGDVITYTYSLANTGNVPLHNISVSNNVAGIAVYQSGDTNANTILNPAETWIYVSSYTVQPTDPSPLVATATISAVTTLAVTMTTTEIVSTPIVPSGPTVVITSPADGATVDSRTIQVIGTVSDTSITSGNITINGESHAIAVTEGTFSTSENINNGQNVITVSVTDGSGNTGSATVTINAQITTYAIRIELTWDTDGTDVDSHLIQPGGTYFQAPGDCFFGNRNPNWGVAGETVDNPSLDQDDTNGYGPENITLQQPYENGVYYYKVHYWSDYGYGSSNATVRIWINGNKVAELNKLLVNNEVWDCAYIDWPSGTVNGPLAGIAVDKTADRAMAHVGDTVTYSYSVTNTGNTALGNITVTDDLVPVITQTGGDLNENALLDLTETWSYTALYPVGEAAPDTLVNTANVTGTYGTANVTAVDSVTVLVLRPGIALDKAAAPATAYVGDNVTYTYTVTNTGNTPLNNVTLNDDLLGAINNFTGDTNADGTLDTIETWIFTANYTTSFEDAGLLENIGIASGTDALERMVQALDSAAVTVLTGGITLDKSANVTMAHVGDNITYTYTVTALGNYALFNVSVIDDRLGEITDFTGDTDGDSDLDTNETWVFSANYTVDAGDPDLLVNTATATGMDNWEYDVLSTDSVSVSILKPGIALVKTAGPFENLNVGDNVTYTYTVTNTGNTPLSGILLTDDRIDVLDLIDPGNGDDILDTGEIWVYTAVYTVLGTDTCPIVNIAVVSGQYELLLIVTAQAIASVELAN